jgi:hypothetical protein
VIIASVTAILYLGAKVNVYKVPAVPHFMSYPGAMPCSMSPCTQKIILRNFEFAKNHVVKAVNEILSVLCVFFVRFGHSLVLVMFTKIYGGSFF